jgi:hypothetical protein
LPAANLEADLEIVQMGWQKEKQVWLPINNMRATWTLDGLRLSYQFRPEAIAWKPSAETSKSKVDIYAGVPSMAKPFPLSELPPISPEAFSSIPADAQVAAAMGISPGWVATADISVLIRGFFFASQTASPLLKAALDALDHADGTVLLWLQPQALIPALTVSVPLPAPQAETVLAALGQPRAADGTVAITLGTVLARVVWRDGRLWLTTHAQGLDGCRGLGFAEHPEVKAALAEMPATAPVFAAVLRPLALSEQFAPLAAVALPGDAMERITTWQQAMRQGKARSWLHLAPDGESWKLEGSGVIGVAAAAAAGVGLLGDQGPLRLLKGVN